MWSNRTVFVEHHRPLGTANNHPTSNCNFVHNYPFVDLLQQMRPENHTYISSAADVPFVLRIVVQGLLPGLPPDVSAEAQNLSAGLNAALHGIDQAATGLIELCPACQVEIPLVDITNALCTNGHAWGMLSRSLLALYVHILLPSSMLYHFLHLGYPNGTNVHRL